MKSGVRILEGIKTALLITTLVVLGMSGVFMAVTCAAENTDNMNNSGTAEHYIEFIKSTDSIKAGKKFTFSVETDCELPVKWTVGNAKKASINQKGVFKAKKPGKVWVRAYVEDVFVGIKVTIKPKKVVAIDAGHQLRGDSSTEPIGPGASTRKAKVAGGTSGIATKTPEYKVTLDVAKKLRKELINCGYKVVMIRNKNDVNISNMERAKKANKSSDICIRIHADGIGDSSVTGASALCPSPSNKYVSHLSKKSRKLSECVLYSMCAKTGAKNRGISLRDDLTGTNWSTIPVTLIETGFMSNREEDKKLNDNNYQTKLAAGMAEGIETYFGYKK